MEIKIPREKKCSLQSVQSINKMFQMVRGSIVFSVVIWVSRLRDSGLPPSPNPHQTTPQKSAQIVSFSVFSPPHREFDKVYYLWSNVNG